MFYLSFCVFWDSLRAFEPKRKAGTFQLYMRIHIYGVEYIPEMCGSTFWQRAPLFPPMTYLNQFSASICLALFDHMFIRFNAYICTLFV